MTKKTDKSRPLPFVALILGWLIPGAGHVYIGRMRRGVIIFVVIAATFWGGVAMGGVMTVDYQTERWWFAAQMLTGIHGLVGWNRQQRIYNDLAAKRDVGPPPPPRTSQRAVWAVNADAELADRKIALVYPTETIARAYSGVAGLLSLICVFDAVMLSLLGVTGEPKPAPAKKPEPEDAP